MAYCLSSSLKVSPRYQQAGIRSTSTGSSIESHKSCVGCGNTGNIRSAISQYHVAIAMLKTPTWEYSDLRWIQICFIAADAFVLCSFCNLQQVSHCGEKKCFWILIRWLEIRQLRFSPLHRSSVWKLIQEDHMNNRKELNLLTFTEQVLESLEVI